MSRYATYGEIQRLYAAEEHLSSVLGLFGFSFSPVLLQGDIANPGLYNLPDLAPAVEQKATYTAAGTQVTDTYTGISLWNFLADAGDVTVTSAKNDILSKYVVATGSDGYEAVFSVGEIAPNFGAQPVTIAYADTAGQLGPNGSDGLARMVVPGDHAGGRYVSDLVTLKVQSLPEPGPIGPGGISDQLSLSGNIADPGIVTPETLSALNQSTTETATYLSGAGQTTDTSDLRPHAIVERAACRRHGKVDIRFVALGHIGDHRAGGGIVDRESLAGCGLHKLPIDQHAGIATKKSGCMTKPRIKRDRVHDVSSWVSRPRRTTATLLWFPLGRCGSIGHHRCSLSHTTTWPGRRRVVISN
jgi:hypothetical protein